MNSRFDKYLKLLKDESSKESLDSILKELHSSFSMLSQEEQKYANIFLHDIQSGDAKFEAGKSFKQYIQDMLNMAESNKIRRVVDILGCSEDILRNLFKKGVNEENIFDYGVFEELVNSVDRSKAKIFFEGVYKDKFSDKNLNMYIYDFLKNFILTNGEDQFGEMENMDFDIIHIDPIDVDVKENQLENKRIVSDFSFSRLCKCYKESKAVSSIISSDSFAYIENSLYLNTPEYVKRNKNGEIGLTSYARENKEKCTVNFIIDEDRDELIYVRLPEVLSGKYFNYFDEIKEKMYPHYKLENGTSSSMLKAINNMDFGNALNKLMSEAILDIPFKYLKDSTGLGNVTISNMRNNKDLSKQNVISTCLAIHIPSRVSKRMLNLANISLDPSKTGEEDSIYDLLIHLAWATNYNDICNELLKLGYEKLIKDPNEIWK